MFFWVHLFYIWVFLVLCHHFPICSVRPFMMRLPLLAIVVFQQDILHSNHSLNHFDRFYVCIKAEMKVKLRSNWFPRPNWSKSKLVILGNSVLNSEHGGFSAILWLKREKWLVFEEKKTTQKTNKRDIVFDFHHILFRPKLEDKVTLVCCYLNWTTVNGEMRCNTNVNMLYWHVLKASNIRVCQCSLNTIHSYGVRISIKTNFWICYATAIINLELPSIPQRY